MWRLDTIARFLSQEVCKKYIRIMDSGTLGLWEFVGLLRLKKANITPAARSVASRRPQNNENNGGIVKKRLQNLFSENRITKTAARKKNNLQNGL